MGVFARMTSRLRQLPDADELVQEAHELLREADANSGLWPAVTALSSKASAKILLADYLREHRKS